MMSKTIEDYYVGEAHWISPHNLKVDAKIASFNPPKPAYSYDALKLLIIADGQTDPVYRRNDLTGDGVHRTQIAQELGVKLLVQDICPSMPDDMYIRLCNKNTFGARNDTPAQAALKAYTLVKEFGYTDIKAMKMIGVKDVNAIGQVRYIADSAHKDLLSVIKDGGRVEIKDSAGVIVYRGTALKSIKEAIARLAEQEMLIVDDSGGTQELVIDYNTIINTETAKKIFWKGFGHSDLTIEYKQLVCALLNNTFKIQEPETSEVT